jgi:hypothetical protein
MQYEEVNMDNYRCYLSVRVQIFKSSGQDLTGEKSFILWVHHPVSKMETLMVAPLAMVTLMMISPSISIPDWSEDLSWAE